MNLAREALSTGTNVLTDMVDDGIEFKESLKNRSSQSLNNLKRKAMATMSGKGAVNSKPAKKRRKSNASSTDEMKSIQSSLTALSEKFNRHLKNSNKKNKSADSQSEEKKTSKKRNKKSSETESFTYF